MSERKRRHPPTVVEIDRIVLTGLDLTPDQLERIRLDTVAGIRRALETDRNRRYAPQDEGRVLAAPLLLGRQPIEQQLTTHLTQTVLSALGRPSGGDHD